MESRSGGPDERPVNPYYVNHGIDTTRQNASQASDATQSTDSQMKKAAAISRPPTTHDHRGRWEA
jgi:hypothetical protein